MKYFTRNEMKCKCCRQLPDEALMNCEALADNVLDPVREKFGRPIKVNSFYRCQKHNKAVGGAPHSQHLCQGSSAAADVCTGEKTVNMQEYIDKQGARHVPRRIGITAIKTCDCKNHHHHRDDEHHE